MTLAHPYQQSAAVLRGLGGTHSDITCCLDTRDTDKATDTRMNDGETGQRAQHLGQVGAGVLDHLRHVAQ